MTGTEIKLQAEKYIDETIDDVDAVTAINRAMNLLGDMALIYESADITSPADGAWVDLPATATNVVEVLLNGCAYSGFRVRDTLISFDQLGTYTVWYRRLPNAISGIADSPEVHAAFHQVLVTYVVAWWKLKDDDENPDGLRREQEFRNDALRVFNTLRRKRGPRTVKVVRHA